MRLKSKKSIPAERTSVNLLAEQIERLKAVFPEVVAEGKVDFEKLKATLGVIVDNRQDRCGEAPATSTGRYLLRLLLLLVLTLSLTAACSGTFQQGVKPSVFIRNSGQDNLIVFFHGVMGDADSTWRHLNGAYWPEMIAGDTEFNDFDVYVLNYESPLIAQTSTIEEIAQRTLQQLRDRGIFERYKQIFFITHSMGGLVAKRLLVELNRRTEEANLRRVRAVLYISTPAQGAEIAELGNWLSLNPQFKDMKPADLNSFLQTLENQWQNLVRDRDTTSAVFPRSYCAYETKPTHGIMIVSRVYAATRCDNSPYAIDLDHIAIAKPPSDQADPYTWTKARIFEAAGRKLVLESLPKADPNRFAVAVAHLENDTNGEYERIIVEALSELEGIQVLQFDQNIMNEGRKRQGGKPQEDIRRAHEVARGYLKASGAHLLIWGTVLRREEQGVPKVYWTVSRDIWLEKRAAHYDLTGVELPDIFWKDMANVLKLLALSYHAEFLALEGRFIGDKLGPFIQRVHRLRTDKQLQKGWSLEAKLQVNFILADSLLTFGEQTGKAGPFVDAVAIYREALEERTRDRVPLDWAMTQTALGTALGRLGEREAGTVHLNEAVAAYREALKEYTRERVPLDWAMTQNNLGLALMRLGERETGTARLNEAIAAFREALKEYTRERVPRDWARTQNNLGNALGALGEREAETTRLEEAVAACREALKEFTRERVPLKWAMTQLNLGTALGRLGEREAGTVHLNEAVAAYREALKEYTRERVPLKWAMTQHNLGNALRVLGDRENRLNVICEALSLHVAAWGIFSNNAPAYASMAATGAAIAIQSMLKGFEMSKVDECLERYDEEILESLLSELGGNEEHRAVPAQ